MSTILRFPNLALGDLEQAVLETLWSAGPLNPVEVHRRIGETRGISVNTVSSALKRLYEKQILTREKVSHAYVYAPAITRAELQREILGALADRFSDEGGAGLMAAFVDMAEAQGAETLRRLERMIADRLGED